MEPAWRRIQHGVVDSAVDGIITINEQGTIESINIAGVRTFSYSFEELIGQNVKLKPTHGWWTTCPI